MQRLLQASARHAQTRDLARLTGVQQRTFASLAAHSLAEPKLPPFAHEPAAYNGPSKQEVMDLRKRHLNPGVCCMTPPEHAYTDGVTHRNLALQPLWPGTKTRS